MAKESKRMELVDLVCFIQGVLQKALPFEWVSFAVDLAELYALRGHFVEGTGEAGVVKLDERCAANWDSQI